MKTSMLRMLSLLVLGTWLTGCGGGSEPVTSVAVPGLKYTGTTSVLTVELTGTALDNGIKVYANSTRCIEGSVVSANARSATCIITVPASLQLPIKVTSASDYTVFTSILTVPKPQVSVRTTLGDFVLELDPTKAKETVNNFLKYVNVGFYSGTLFHRVIANFMVQGGGYTAGPTSKAALLTTPPLELESTLATGLSNTRGTVAMARANASNSGTSQFFVNHVDNLRLNYSNDTSPGYAVFGKVISGMNVIDNIAATPTETRNGLSDVPVTDITITSATQTQ